MAALKDIAIATGVSIGTVSRILNQGRGHLYNPATRQRVIEASQRLKYRPNRSAQAMRSQKTRIVGFASPNVEETGFLENYGVFPFVVGLSRRLSEENYRVVLVNDMVDPGRPEEPWSVQERFLDALVAQYGFTDRAMRFAKNVGVPLVWWDSGVFSKHNAAYRDEIAVSREATRKLIDLGHRHIGYVTGRKNWDIYTAGHPGKLHYSYIHRFEGYRDEMRACGLIECPIVHDMNDLHQIATQMKEHEVTAVIATGHDLAIYSAAQLLNWRIPQELSLATLDLEARIVTHAPRIGGMQYDRLELGKQVADMILTILETDKAEVPFIRYVGQFEMGDTIGPPRKKA
jgi:LacI family transcriptional regulator